MRVEVYKVLPSELVEPFWELYHESFSPLAALTAARHLLRKDEFLHEMNDELIDKYVVWDGETAVSLSTLTRHLETVPWISPEFFAAKYPEYYEKSLIYYLGFTLVKPVRQRQKVYTLVLTQINEEIAGRGGICGFDICSYNREVLKFDQRTIRQIERDVNYGTEIVDTQAYFVATPKKA